MRAAESDSKRIIEEQAKKIEELEEKVKEMDDQLDFYNVKLKDRDEMQYWRFEGVDVSVNYLKAKWKQMDYFLSLKYPEAWPIDTEVKSQDEDSSEDEPSTSEKPSDHNGANGNHCKDFSAYEIKFLGGVTVIECTNEVSKEALKVESSPKEQDKKIQSKRRRRGWSPSQSVPNVEVDMWEECDIFGDLFDDSLSMDIPQEENVPNEETPCKCCGLSCVTQLRACVNMINVKPSMSKVKENEAKAMKSKKKNGLERIWVPRGMFDIKELYKVDTIIVEDHCVKPYMPRWKKRKKKTPTICDSCD